MSEDNAAKPRKPLDAGCFEGDSTKAGPKSLVQLYERGPFAKPFAKVSTRNHAISVTYGEWCNGSTTVFGLNR